MAINCKRNKERDREIIRLRDRLRMTFKEIAKQLGISAPRVRQLYVRLVKEREQANAELKDVI